MRFAPVACLSLVLCVLVVGCAGTTVDRESPRFVDTEPAGAINDGSPAAPAVRNETARGYTLPPGYTETNETDLATLFAGKDAATLWVWNGRGSQRVFMAEGSSVSLPGAGVNLTLVLVSADAGGSVVVAVDGKRSSVLRRGDEQLVGGSWVLLRDVIVR